MLVPVRYRDWRLLHRGKHHVLYDCQRRRSAWRSAVYLFHDGDGKMLRKPFVATLLSIILIVTSGDGKTATQKRYEAVTLGVKRAIDSIRHQLPKRVDEVTTLTDAYIDPNDDRKVVFVSTLSVAKDDIDRRKWEDLGRKLRRQACADDLFKDSIQHSRVRLLYRYIDQHGQSIGEFLVNNC
jgi:hypothetical protein